AAELSSRPGRAESVVSVRLPRLLQTFPGWEDFRWSRELFGIMGFRMNRARGTISRIPCFWIALAAVLSTGCTNPARDASLRQYAFITNEKSNTATVVDLGNFQVLRSIPVGKAPAAI